LHDRILLNIAEQQLKKQNSLAEYKLLIGLLTF